MNAPEKQMPAAPLAAIAEAFLARGPEQNDTWRLPGLDIFLCPP